MATPRTHGLPLWALNSPEAADLAAPGPAPAQEPTQEPTQEPARPAPDASTPDPTAPATPPARRLRRLTCCCCGERAPAYGQWWNRDTGYGLCPRCVVWLESRADYDPDDFRECYGEEGVHWLRHYPGDDAEG